MSILPSIWSTELYSRGNTKITNRRDKNVNDANALGSCDQTAAPTHSSKPEIRTRMIEDWYRDREYDIESAQQLRSRHLLEAFESSGRFSSLAGSALHQAIIKKIEEDPEAFNDSYAEATCRIKQENPNGSITISAVEDREKLLHSPRPELRLYARSNFLSVAAEARKSLMYRVSQSRPGTIAKAHSARKGTKLVNPTDLSTAQGQRQRAILEGVSDENNREDEATPSFGSPSSTYKLHSEQSRETNLCTSIRQALITPGAQRSSKQLDTIISWLQCCCFMFDQLDESICRAVARCLTLNTLNPGQPLDAKNTYDVESTEANSISHNSANDGGAQNEPDRIAQPQICSSGGKAYFVLSGSLLAVRGLEVKRVAANDMIGSPRWIAIVKEHIGEHMHRHNEVTSADIKLAREQMQHQSLGHVSMIASYMRSKKGVAIPSKPASDKISNDLSVSHESISFGNGPVFSLPYTNNKLYKHEADTQTNAQISSAFLFSAPKLPSDVSPESQNCNGFKRNGRLKSAGQQLSRCLEQNEHSLKSLRLSNSPPASHLQVSPAPAHCSRVELAQLSVSDFERVILSEKAKIVRHMASWLPRNVPVFSACPLPQMLALSRCFKVRRFAAGDIIYTQGSPIDVWCLLKDGLVELVANVPVRLPYRLPQPPAQLARGRRTDQVNAKLGHRHVATVRQMYVKVLQVYAGLSFGEEAILAVLPDHARKKLSGCKTSNASIEYTSEASPVQPPCLKSENLSCSDEESVITWQDDDELIPCPKPSPRSFEQSHAPEAHTQETFEESAIVAEKIDIKSYALAYSRSIRQRRMSTVTGPNIRNGPHNQQPNQLFSSSKSCNSSKTLHKSRTAGLWAKVRAAMSSKTLSNFSNRNDMQALRPYTAIAVRDSTVLMLDPEHFNHLHDDSMEVLRSLLRAVVAQPKQSALAEEQACILRKTAHERETVIHELGKRYSRRLCNTIKERNKPYPSRTFSIPRHQNSVPATSINNKQMSASQSPLRNTSRNTERDFVTPITASFPVSSEAMNVGKYCTLVSRITHPSERACAPQELKDAKSYNMAHQIPKLDFHSLNAMKDTHNPRSLKSDTKRGISPRDVARAIATGRCRIGAAALRQGCRDDDVFDEGQDDVVRALESGEGYIRSHDSTLTNNSHCQESYIYFNGEKVSQSSRKFTDDEFGKMFDSISQRLCNHTSRELLERYVHSASTARSHKSTIRTFGPHSQTISEKS